MPTFAQKQNQPKAQVSSRLVRPQLATPYAGSCNHPIHDLQRIIGNQAVLRMLQIPAEPGVAREHLQRKEDRASTSEGTEAPPIVHEVLGSSSHPLDSATRAFMEPRFGHDLSRVRVHTDARAAESAAAVSSRAYAVGDDVVFATGQYAPGTGEGRRLIAHELTHVLQRSGVMAGTVQRQQVPAAWQSVTITPSEVHVNNCGNTKWEVNFSVAPNATDGWIIQELSQVDVDLVAQQTSTEHFWEAWPVAARASGPARAQGDHDDTFLVTTGSVRWGGHTWSGKVRYYPLAMMPGATAAAIPGFARDQFGQLQTTHQPGFWSGEGGAQHTLAVSWDCRPGHTGRPTVTMTPTARVLGFP
jgi:hypothetical protein